MVQIVSIIEEERRVEEELRDIRKKIETKAWQRCRPFLLWDGDKNTSYFHYQASHPRKRNRIEFLRDAAGVDHFEQEKLLRIVRDYYKDLFSSSRPPISVNQIDHVEV